MTDTTGLTAEERADLDETELGRVVWHTSEEDGGPDVGLQLGLGEGRSLYVGEMSNAALERAEIGQEYPDGWWIVLYSGDDTEIAGAVCDMDGARSLFDALTSLATDNAALTARAEKAEQMAAAKDAAIQEAIDLLLERIHHNPARSASHNARLTLQAALSPVAEAAK